MRVLVTGASGLIGRHTVDLLARLGHQVRAFQRHPLDGIESVRGDVRCAEDSALAPDSARDVAGGIGVALELPADGRLRVYNIATGVGTTFRQLANLIVELTGAPGAIEERLADEPAGRDLLADIGRARTERGYRPCADLRVGRAGYVAWLRTHA